MLRQLPNRQRVRKALLIFVFLTFPITMNYLSPYVIIDASMNGVVNASLVMFGLMFVSSLFVGRLWCGWVCPGGGMGEIVEPLNPRLVNGKKIDWIKWAIWIPWISLIGFLVIRAGGYSRINLLHLTESGVSVDAPIKYLVYYIVVGLFFGLALIVGKRAGCHTICWMAPFMMIGRWIRNRFGWASLRLQSNADSCVDCKRCNLNCPMSLDVNHLVHQPSMEHSECILCGNCVDSCHKGAIVYRFSAGR